VLTHIGQWRGSHRRLSGGRDLQRSFARGRGERSGWASKGRTPSRDACGRGLGEWEEQGAADSEGTRALHRERLQRERERVTRREREAHGVIRNTSALRAQRCVNEGQQGRGEQREASLRRARARCCSGESWRRAQRF
jgi:hypothetical protein